MSILLRRNSAILLTIVILLTACAQTSAQPAPQESPSEATAAPPPSITLAVAQPTQPDPSAVAPALASSATPASPASQRTRYILDATLNYGQHHLKVDEQIFYRNQTPDALIELVLMVDPLYYFGVFQLKDMAWDDGQPVEGYTQEAGWLRLPLRLPLKPGEAIKLNLSYELSLPAPARSPLLRPIPFGYSERQANLVDWYPFIPPYLPGKGWLAHKAGYYGEHLVYESADFEVNIQIEDKRPDLIIAASAPATQDGAGYHYRHENARNFAWSASHQYQIATRKVGDTTLLGYSFPFHKEAGERALQTAAQALELYSRLFGPYPRQQLSVVEADFLDGMEFDGLFFLSNGFYNLFKDTPAEYLVAISAHETAHQWWYAQVGNDQALEPWLDEALCTYSERLFYENVYPEALDWWWQYRVNFYQSRGWVDQRIYNPYGETEAYRAYRDAVYLNGAVFLEELRKLIGDQAFFEFLKDYPQKYAYQIATGNDFFTTLRKHTQTDLAPLTAKYFANPP